MTAFRDITSKQAARLLSFGVRRRRAMGMAVHQVDMTLPTREIGRADAVFEVRADGEMLGALHVSRGAVVWFPSGTTYGYKLGWARFDEFMQAHGHRNEAR